MGSILSRNEPSDEPGTIQPLADRPNTYTNGHATVALANNGTMLYFPRVLVGDRLAWLDPDGLVTTVIEEEGVRYHSYFSLSPDGGRLAVTRHAEGGEDEVVIVELSSGRRSRLPVEGDSRFPLWSPDGLEIVFGSRKEDGSMDLFVTNVDGTGESRPLLVHEFDVAPVSWTPDGRTVLYRDVNPDLETETWMLPIGGEPVPLLLTPGRESSLAISPDGNWLAFVSDVSGRNEVYVQRFPEPDIRRQVSIDGGTSSVWSPDGSSLFFRVGDTLFSAPVVTEASLDEVATPRRVAEAPFGTEPGTNFAVSPDGSRFVFIQRPSDRLSGQARLVFNWFEELRRLVPTN